MADWIHAAGKQRELLTPDCQAAKDYAPFAALSALTRAVWAIQSVDWSEVDDKQATYFRREIVDRLQAIVGAAKITKLP